MAGSCGVERGVAGTGEPPCFDAVCYALGQSGESCCCVDKTG